MQFCISVTLAKRNQQCYVKKKHSRDASCETQAFGFTCLGFFYSQQEFLKKTRVKNKVLTSHTIKGYNILYDSPGTNNGQSPFDINHSRLEQWELVFEVLSFYFFLLIELVPQQCTTENNELLISMYKVNRNGDNLSDTI